MINEYRGIDVDCTSEGKYFVWSFIFNKEKFTKKIILSSVNTFRKEFLDDFRNKIDYLLEKNENYKNL